MGEGNDGSPSLPRFRRRYAELASVPLAVIRRQVSSAELSKVVPEGCGIVWNFIRANGLKGGRNVALYWDGAIRLEVGVEMSDPFTEVGEVVHSATPAGWVASVTHHGPYARLHLAHSAIRDWCAAHQRRRLGPSWEIYGHWQEAWNADPELIRTDVHYLVSPPSS
jgi:effector-binding domain-containing protein